MKALFLDLDGTLADSLSVMEDVYMRFLSTFGHMGNGTEFDQLNGPPLSEVVRILKEKYALPGTVDGLKDQYYALVDEIYKTVQPMDGAQDLITLAKKKGMNLGIVTSNRRKLVEAWLDQNKLISKLDVLIALEDIDHGKPHPDPYLKALAQSGLTARDAMAVEDSPQGAQSASTAGLTTFALMQDPEIWKGVDQSPYIPVNSLADVSGRIIDA